MRKGDQLTVQANGVATNLPVVDLMNESAIIEVGEGGQVSVIR